MWLNAYIERIGYAGAIEPSLACLVGVHRAHALAIPYENLDVQLNRPVRRDLDHLVDKLVHRRRGGWCYEMNTLFAQALSEIGFNVRLVTGGIHRFERGDAALGNHILALVDLEGTYLADLGLGDGIREPIPLREGTYRQGSLSFRLARIDGGYWRFTNHDGGFPESYDFSEEPIDDEAIERRSRDLQTSPDSVFVQNLVVQQMRESTLSCLTGRIFRTKFSKDNGKTLIQAPGELEALMSTEFGIRDAELQSVWPRLRARHETLFGDCDIAEVDVSTFGRLL